MAEQATVGQPGLTKPIRKKVIEEKPDSVRLLLNNIATYFPDLKVKLTQAGMTQNPAEFISYAIQSALMLACMLTIILGMIIYGMYNDTSKFMYLIAAFPIVLIFAFFYSMLLPTVKMKQREREIDRELVFAGRQMLIELKGGVPMFDAMLGITRDYGEVSKEFNKIVEKITLGVPADIAMQEVSNQNPSSAFRRVILQLVNSLRSGSDVAKALEVALEQISKEQVIALKEYGQKLNPLVMFFMIFGIILPSLGVALAIIMLAFIGTGVKIPGNYMLGGAFVLLAGMQFMFITMIDSSRPKFDIA